MAAAKRKEISIKISMRLIISQRQDSHCSEGYMDDITDHLKVYN